MLDANVLIALVVAEHDHHDEAARWVAEAGAIALCPIVEGALVRLLVRAGESQQVASAILEALYRAHSCAFWPDSVSYATVSLDRVLGHRQVTDAYLAALAVSNGGRLATFDHALADALPDATELIRASGS